MHYSTPYYTWDLSICRCWYPWGGLKPVPCRYRGTIVVKFGGVKKLNMDSQLHGGGAGSEGVHRCGVSAPNPLHYSRVDCTFFYCTSSRMFKIFTQSRRMASCYKVLKKNFNIYTIKCLINQRSYLKSILIMNHCHFQIYSSSSRFLK